MSKFKKPKSELTQLESRLLYKNLGLTYLKDLSCDELNKLSDSGISLKFHKGLSITKRNEPIVWFGILLEGDLLMSIGNDGLGSLKPGSFIGSLAVLEYKQVSTNIYDLTGNSDGVISCFLLEDLENIHRKMPKIAMKFIEIIGKTALNSVSYNLNLNFLFASNHLTFTEYSTRRKQEFVNRHPLLQNSELDRIDIKILASIFKVVHFTEQTWLTRKGTLENSVFFVIEGRCGNYESREYEEDVFGAEHFLIPNTLWEESVIGTGEGVLLWMRLEEFSDIIIKESTTCTKFLKLITTYVSRKVFDRKTQKLPVSVNNGQDFIELDPSQLPAKFKLNQITEESDEEAEQLFPLYTFPMFETKLKEKEEKRPDSPENLFPKERLNKQIIEQKSKKKKRERTVSPRPRKETKKKDISAEVTEIVKDLVRDISQMEEINTKLLEEIQKFNEENLELERKIAAEDLEVENKEVKLKKNRVMKDIEKIKDCKEVEIKTAKSFLQITNDQAKTSKAFYLAWKYAEKWKEYVRRVREARKISDRD